MNTSEIRPDMSAALADLDELRVLSVRFGYDLFGALANLTKRGLPVLLCDVGDIPRNRADHAVAHFKLAEELRSVLAALRTQASACHIGHSDPPDIPDDLILESYRILRPGGVDPPDLDNHKAAVQELILALLARGWTIAPPAST